MKKKEDYYTYAQIVNSLRKYYQESQEILEEMEEYIEVDSKDKCNKELRLVLREDKPTYSTEPNLILSVSRDYLASPATYVRNSVNQMVHDEYRWQKDHATYVLTGDEDHLKFKPYESVIFGEHFSPKLKIPKDKREAFQSAYKRLTKSALYALPECYVKINPFQNLLINGDGITLNSEGENGKGIRISYNPTDDKIHVNSLRKYSTGFIEDLLETEIPKYEFSDIHYFAMEGNRKPSEAYIDDILRSRYEVLSLEDQPKRLMLTRDI